MDRIELTGMEFTGYHGCFDFEKKHGQSFIVDARLYFPLQEAGISDDLHDTIDYAAVFESVRAIVEGKPVNLLEKLAEDVAACLLKEYPLQAVRIAVHKPGAPLPGRFQDVCVHIKRSREA